MNTRYVVIAGLFLSILPILALYNTLNTKKPRPSSPAAISTTTSASLSSSPKQSSSTTPAIPLRTNFSKVALLHFGDAMFDRGIRMMMNKGVDPFADLKRLSIVEDYDIRMLNLEGPIIETPRSRCQQKPYSFQFATSTASLLSTAGITLVTLGNNHSLDCFQTGLDSTVAILNETNIATAGYPSLSLSAYRTHTKEGTRISVIGYDATLSVLKREEILKVVRKEVEENNIVIFSVHWGEEYEPMANDTQTTFAHQLIDLGVHAVIGSHPHVVQNFELYKGRPIFYSLGNFIFDQKGEKENRGFGVGIVFFNDHIETMLYPYTIITGTPTFLSMKDANAWCNHYYGAIPFVEVNGCAASFQQK